MSLCQQTDDCTAAPTLTAASTALMLPHILAFLSGSASAARPCQIITSMSGAMSLPASAARSCVGTRNKTRCGSPAFLARRTNEAISSRNRRDLPPEGVILMARCGGAGNGPRLCIASRPGGQLVDVLLLLRCGASFIRAKNSSMSSVEFTRYAFHQPCDGLPLAAFQHSALVPDQGFLFDCVCDSSSSALAVMRSIMRTCTCRPAARQRAAVAALPPIIVSSSMPCSPPHGTGPAPVPPRPVSLRHRDGRRDVGTDGERATHIVVGCDLDTAAADVAQRPADDAVYPRI